VAAIQRRKDEFSERQISVVVVTFESVEGSKIWIRETNCDFPVFIDPDRKLYSLFGLSRSIYKSFNTKVLRYYSESIVKDGEVPAAVPGSLNDFLQMGGDFTLSASAKVVFSYPSQDASDRPHLNDILKAAMEK